MSRMWIGALAIFAAPSVRERRVRAALLVGAVALLGACAARSPGAELYPHLAEFTDREIERVQFAGYEPVPVDSLRALVVTRASHCSILGVPICLPGVGVGRRERRLNLETLREDVNRLAVFYRQAGYFGTTVRPEVLTARNGEDGVLVRFVINRGDAIRLDSLLVQGTEGIMDPDSLESELPLRAGELFNLRRFVGSADTVLSGLRFRGHLYGEVLRNYAVDTTSDRATAWLVAVPGPRVEVDSVIVVGAEQLGRDATERQLTFGTQDLLRATELVESQRNLYNLELVQFATVSVAEDSLQLTPSDSTRATVVVRVSEASRHVVEATLGYGDIECFRTEAQWVDRSFGPGARRLSVTGSLSKIGIGEPLDVGLSGSPVCEAFTEDRFGRSVDFRVAADLTQPFFISPRNQLSLSAFVERQSEPSLFQRRSEGGRLALSHRLGREQAVTVSADFERSRTDASEVLFCFTFQVCRPEDFQQLADARWRNRLGASWFLERTDRLIDPRDGTVIRANAEWATPLLLSELDFVRANADFVVYEPFAPGWIGAAFLRIGTFLTGGTLERNADFLPPEDRFFAGGANSVRGFDRNELGRGVYVIEDPTIDPRVSPELVRFVPTGGTSVVVGSAELRLPSPVLADLLRLALFVDAGALTSEDIWDVEPDEFRVTPGAGIRLRTPVGPARIDLAYNPHDPPRGVLFLAAANGDARAGGGALVPILRNFRPPQPSFGDRLRLHIAVGQAF